MKLTLNTSLAALPGIGPSYSKKLKSLGLARVRDLLFYFPFRYDNFAKLSPISDLGINETVSVRGEVLAIKSIRTPRKHMALTEALVADETGTVKAVWFNQPFIVRNIHKGSTICLSGKTSYNEDGLVFSNPTYEMIYKNREDRELMHTGRLVPVYHESYAVSSKYLRAHILPLLNLAKTIKDHLPPAVKKKYDLEDLSVAIREIHFPTSPEAIEKAKRRLAFDELFMIELFVMKIRVDSQQKDGAVSIKFTEDIKEVVQKFVKGLPFQMTQGQRIASWEIIKDMERSTPMNRLLEGDVGSGKTLVAVMSALVAARSGYQVAIMAPTEVLAEQHFEKISKLLIAEDIKLGLITSSKNRIFLRGKGSYEDITAKELAEKVSKGEIKLLIGTHSLISEKVSFKNLALVVVDEQHRFGVEQRATLQKKVTTLRDGIPAAQPHFLSMTATPIPRTLALTVYGDLDISILKEMPGQRLKIITQIVAPANRDNAYLFVRDQVKKGHQAFVICPLIEESDKLEAASAIEEHNKLSLKVFPDLRIGLLHGRMKSVEKEKVMRDFLEKKIDILVTTAVVEVGIDIPNATVILIEGADRFGLAQLHQFRGRVGRSKWQSYCLLFTDSPSSTTHKRLKAIIEAKDGFELAEKDLEIRGPGEFYGVRQSGLPSLVMAKFTDTKLVKECRECAENILKIDPTLVKFPSLKSKLSEFRENIHLE